MSHVVETKLQKYFPLTRTAWLVIGDMAALLIFVLVGRRNHSLSISDIGAILATAAPFWIGWFVVAPWFGLFRPDVCRSGRRWLPRLLLAWAIGGSLALILRTVFLGRPILGGVSLPFAIVTFVVTTVLLIVWRLIYSWRLKWASEPADTGAN
ncbi:MAG: DUF3054 domain-containing protein [Anaerolineae bacterium]|nr:DUF3054 domain-containing protein [Anaerolineae bacterium]